MFRCQFSGELSEPAEYGYAPVSTDESNTIQETQRRKRVLLKPAEKPVRVAVKFRSVAYQNDVYDEEGYAGVSQTQGFEITKELLIRKQHLDAVKKKYNL